MQQLRKEFYDELHRIFQAPFDGEFPERRRWIELHALGIKFMQYLGVDEHSLDKAMLWLEALSDLEDGVTAPILKAKGKKPEPPTSAIWRARAALAIALEYLIEAGISDAKALNEVAKTPGIEKLLRRKGSGVEASLKNWRVTLREKSVSNDLANQRWDASRKVITGFRKAIAEPTGKRDKQEIYSRSETPDRGCR